MEVLISALRTSTGMPSGPGSFPFCCFQIAFAISSLLGVVSNLDYASRMTTGSVGGGWFSNFLK